MSYWPTTGPEHAHMRRRQIENRERAERSRAERWMFVKLATTGHRWTRQAQSGLRLFDFWNHQLGIAVEVDGPEHDPERERKRDYAVRQQRAILVLRVRNFNEDDARKALRTIATIDTWNIRRRAIGLAPVNGAG